MKRILVLGCGGTAAANWIKCLRKQEAINLPTLSVSEEWYIVGTDLNEYQLQAADVNEGYLEDLKGKKFTKFINEIVDAQDIEFVYAAPDIWVKRLGQRRDKIRAKTFLPSNLALARCQDKYTTYQCLKEANVPVPATFPIESIASGSVRLAELFKDYHTVWVRARGGAGSKAALPCRSIAHFEMWVDYWQGRGMFPSNFIVCEFLPGPEYAWQGLYYQGQLICYFARERLEYVFGHLMPSGQSSSPSVAKWIHNANVFAIGDLAVRAVDPEPHGIYGVDMKTGIDGKIKVTEINAGRFYTTSDFAAAVGLNLPYMFVRCAYGEHVQWEMIESHKEAYWIRNMDREPFLWTKK